MKKQSVYTHRICDDVGAFHEDALSFADAAATPSPIQDYESMVSEIMESIIEGMKRMATDESRRREIAKLLV
ncbi:hypothetical protein KY487_18715 [Ralstonia pseudosolanacearum]|uniref:hypothetical protein n=1 Tax=Ralstonia pseudosolanacearum TaxID=1310165 RepID=UPI001C8B65D9|nr:hypothetical protein [Ralstonia pseudosolanacearum]MBX9431288.1 hypothetical protein [Ralstonia pseudosolanacearum]